MSAGGPREPKKQHERTAPGAQCLELRFGFEGGRGF